MKTDRWILKFYFLKLDLLIFKKKKKNMVSLWCYLLIQPGLISFATVIKMLIVAYETRLANLAKYIKTKYKYKK